MNIDLEVAPDFEEMEAVITGEKEPSRLHP